MEITSHFGLSFNSSLENQWFLDGPYIGDENDYDGNLFTTGKTLDIKKPLKMIIEESGQPLRFSFGAMDVIIVEKQVGDEINKINCEIQTFPVAVEGMKRNYVILNLPGIECIDTKKSKYNVWGPGQGVAEKIYGKFSYFDKMVLCKSKIKDKHFFRVKGWEPQIVISNVIKDLLQNLCSNEVLFSDMHISNS